VQVSRPLFFHNLSCENSELSNRSYRVTNDTAALKWDAATVGEPCSAQRTGVGSRIGLLLVAFATGRRNLRYDSPLPRADATWFITTSRSMHKAASFRGTTPRLRLPHERHLRLLWNFWKQMRRPASQWRSLLFAASGWKESEDDQPRARRRSGLAWRWNSWNLLYGYLGDQELHPEYAGDGRLLGGARLPTKSCSTVGWPYPYNTNTQSGVYDGDMRAGKGYLQPDKAGSFGAQLVTAPQITGDKALSEGGRPP